MYVGLLHVQLVKPVNILNQSNKNHRMAQGSVHILYNADGVGGGFRFCYTVLYMVGGGGFDFCYITLLKLLTYVIF